MVVDVALTVGGVTVRLEFGADCGLFEFSPNVLEDSLVKGIKLGLGAGDLSLLASSCDFELAHTVCVTEDNLLAFNPGNASFEGANVKLLLLLDDELVALSLFTEPTPKESLDGAKIGFKGLFNVVEDDPEVVSFAKSFEFDADIFSYVFKSFSRCFVLLDIKAIYLLKCHHIIRINHYINSIVLISLIAVQH